MSDFASECVCVRARMREGVSEDVSEGVNQRDGEGGEEVEGVCVCVCARMREGM